MLSITLGQNARWRAVTPSAGSKLRRQQPPWATPDDLHRTVSRRSRVEWTSPSSCRLRRLQRTPDRTAKRPVCRPTADRPSTSAVSQHAMNMCYVKPLSLSTVWVKKNLPQVMWHFFTFSQPVENILSIFLHIHYTFLSTIDFKFLFNYLQCWRSYAILSATT